MYGSASRSHAECTNPPSTPGAASQSGNLQTQRHSAKQSVTHAHGLFYSFLVTHSVYLVPYKLPFKRATSTSVSFYYLFSLILFKIKEQQENPAHCKLHVIHLCSIIAYVMVDTSCQLDRLRRLTKRLKQGASVSARGRNLHLVNIVILCENRAWRWCDCSH